MAPDEDSYDRLLQEFTKFAEQTHQYRIRTETALEEMSVRLNTFWSATAKGMRQLADWFADTEDEARKERTAERSRRSQREWAIIALLVIIIVGGVFALVHFWR